MLPRLVPIVACGAMMVATEGRAQEMDTYRRASRFDIGVYGGGSLTSNWFESRTVTLNGTDTPMENDDDEGFSPGTGGAFGALANLWLTPAFGIRAHGVYLPMKLPNSDDEAFDNDGYVMNTYAFDLNLALRPFATRAGSPWMSSLYLFAGGGGLMVDLAGEDQPLCEGTLAQQGACLSFEPEQTMVGQGTAGLGVDLIPIGPLALFAEAAVHVYDSPVHTTDFWLGPIRASEGATVRIADDATAVTGRLVLGLKAMFGNLIPPPPPVEVPPPPVVAPPPPVVAPPPPPNPMREIRVCVVENGALREITAMYNTQTGDTTVNGQRIPATMGYAAGATWYINNEPITVMERRYVRYGLPRVLGVNEVTRAGEFQGVSVFAEAG
ncbi:MAG TPA: hypothetical protein VFY65_17285, partial [Longimicrobium sp.]|nr:hypothetical protein [Longimicrobium sp.]